MNRIFFIISILLLSCGLYAQELVQEDTTLKQTPEAHIFATFVKSFDHGLSLTIEEEIRSAPSHRAHTTLGLGYAPLPYLNIYAAYTVMLYGTQGWDDPKKFLRHRANVLVTGQVKLGGWNLSLREGVMMDARMDEVDRREKNAVDLTLRSRLQAVYSIPNTPLGIVGKMEILNTLNAPTAYLNEVSSDKKYGEYINELRPEAGLQWKINKQNSLTLTYRFNYLYSRNINVLDNKDVELTHAYTHKHLILLAYKFGW